MRKRLALASILSLIGAGSAAYLSHVYYATRNATGGFQSLCNLSEKMSCSSVALSRWAELIPGLPLSSFVAGWMATLLILTLLARSQEYRRDAVATGLVMSGLGSLYSLLLIYVMFGRIGAICVFCLAIDAVNFGLFAIFLSMREKPLFAGVQMKRVQNFAILALVAMFVSVVVQKPVQSQDEKEYQNQLALLVQSTLAQKPAELKLPANTPSIGNPAAPVTIVEFSDFQCPFCRRAALMLKSVQSKFKDDVRIVYVPFPLDGSCNRVVNHAMHPFACGLARAALCAEEKGKFEAVYEKIFEEQESLNGTSAEKIPVGAGVDPAFAKSCGDSDAAKTRLSMLIEEGIRMNVESTPTLYVNGLKVDGPQTMEFWEKLIPMVPRK